MSYNFRAYTIIHTHQYNNHIFKLEFVGLIIPTLIIHNDLLSPKWKVRGT